MYNVKCQWKFYQAIKLKNNNDPFFKICIIEVYLLKFYFESHLI